MTKSRVYSCVGDAHKDTYHYTQCGLDNVYLTSGYTLQEVSGKEYVRITNVEGLWKAIGISIATEQNELTPQEIRFLRAHMNLTQGELAKKLGVDQQTLARWEKAQTQLPGPADLALRTLFLTSPAAQPEGSEIIGELYDLIDKREGETKPEFSAKRLIRTMGMDQDKWKTSTNSDQLELAI
tara:strand:+ start:7427 stop:7972 length:546 start_codon:yes stop_codon:yes gene_type:complete